MIFGGNLQNRGNRIHVRVQRWSNQLGHVLIDENDGDVFSQQKAFEAVVDVADARVFVDDEKVGTSRFVHFPDAAEQKPGTRVFIANHRYQLSSAPEKRHFWLVSTDKSSEVSIRFVKIKILIKQIKEF